MNGWGWFFLILFLIFLVYAAWCAWRFISAKRQGLPPPPMKSYIPFMKSDGSATNYPTPRSSGPFDWVKDQFSKLSNRRTAKGAYEEAGGAERGLGGRRGRGLEDDAWDARVGNEDAYGVPGSYYNEEQELGLAPTPGYTNEPYDRSTGDYLSSNTGYAGGNGGAPRDHSENPFGDENRAPSLRSVSPRPEVDMKGKGKDSGGLDSGGSSPTSVRKSVFREGI